MEDSVTVWRVQPLHTILSSSPAIKVNASEVWPFVWECRDIDLELEWEYVI